MNSDDVLQFNKKSKTTSSEEEDGAPREKANITLRWKAMEHETIKHICFVDDERP